MSKKNFSKLAYEALKEVGVEGGLSGINYNQYKSFIELCSIAEILGQICEDGEVSADYNDLTDDIYIEVIFTSSDITMHADKILCAMQIAYRTENYGINGKAVIKFTYPSIWKLMRGNKPCYLEQFFKENA